MLVNLPNTAKLVIYAFYACIIHADAFNDYFSLKQMTAMNKTRYFLEEFFSQQKIYFLWKPKYHLIIKITHEPGFVSHEVVS